MNSITVLTNSLPANGAEVRGGRGATLLAGEESVELGIEIIIGWSVADAAAADLVEVFSVGEGGAIASLVASEGEATAEVVVVLSDEVGSGGDTLGFEGDATVEVVVVLAVEVALIGEVFESEDVVVAGILVVSLEVVDELFDCSLGSTDEVEGDSDVWLVTFVVVDVVGLCSVVVFVSVV